MGRFKGLQTETSAVQNERRKQIFGIKTYKIKLTSVKYFTLQMGLVLLYFSEPYRFGATSTVVSQLSIDDDSRVNNLNSSV